MEMKIAAAAFIVIFFLKIEMYFILCGRKAATKKARYNKRTKGVVIQAQREHISNKDEDNRYDYSFRVRYTVGGKDYTADDSAGYARVGQRWTVYYDPSNPQECEVQGSFSAIIWITRIASVVFAFLMVITIMCVMLYM